jgi:ribosomal protein S18 acetylase RimI-like enzyme
LCAKCSSPKQCEYQIHEKGHEDIESLEGLVKLFWGDPVQLMFDQCFTILEQPAYLAKRNNTIVGFIFYTPFREDAMLIVALGILPQFQGCGIGRELVTHVEKFARDQGRRQLLVVTTNDNLPAVAFYQHIGFQLYEVVPNNIAEKLGGIQLGVANIPIRDELRLRKLLQ